MLLAPVSRSPYQGTLHLAYRPDIDGLRALAVLAVLAFHAFPDYFGSGFIGVDIFFVISGYLISAILFQDIAQGRFSIGRFYGRRIRRIFPALALVLGVVLVSGYVLLLPEDYERLGKHVFGGAAFIANIFLWLESGYFDALSLYKPLVHLWSLGIEEQFYIVFPLLLLVIAKLRLDALKTLLVLFLLSFADNVYLSGMDRVAVFYFPLARIWELLAGASLSALFRKPRAGELWLRADRVLARLGGQSVHDGHSLSCVLAAMGILCLGLAICLVREEGYPGITGLLPVAGAVLLIAAGPANPFSKYILSNRIAVFIGLISYPLYLWHWPLLSYAAMFAGTGPDTDGLRIALCCLACVLATLTYVFIERPIRFHLKTTRILLPGLCGLLLCLGLAGGWVYLEHGVPQRLAAHKETDPAVLALRQTLKTAHATFRAIAHTWFAKEEDLKNIMSKMTAPVDKLTIAVIGDSHADHLFPGLVEALGGKSSLALFAGSCAAPYRGIANFSGKRPERKHSAAMISAAYEIILKQENIKTVIISHNAQCSWDYLTDLETTDGETDKSIILERAMRRSFAALTAAHKKVIVILDSPKLPFNPNYCAQDLFPLDNQCRFKRSLFDNDAPLRWYKRILAKVLAEYPQITTVDLSEVLCDDRFCYAKRGGNVLYRDNEHLSLQGSRFLAPEILKALD